LPFPCAKCDLIECWCASFGGTLSSFPSLASSFPIFIDCQALSLKFETPVCLCWSTGWDWSCGFFYEEQAKERVEQPVVLHLNNANSIPLNRWCIIN
jgi:hypothetical protein